jgi:hypothetical protein
MEDFNELDWINQFFDNTIDLQNEGIERIRNFVLLWNMFETFGCNKNANIRTIRTAVENINATVLISNEMLTPFVDYFAGRYFNDKGTSTEIFEGLKFRGGDDIQAKEDVSLILTRQIVESKEVLKGLLFILFRFRNNLFHGEKQVVLLNTQISNFSYANRLLANVLDIMKTNYLIPR